MKTGATTREHVEADREAGTPAVTPRNAASLLVVDLEGDTPRFLMGCRNRGHGFMPSVFVFPGGALEAGDLELAHRFDLVDDVAERLAAPAFPETKHRAAFALAAIRETFEETGQIVGEPALPEEVPANWQAFMSHGYRPALGALCPVGRAVTPPHYPIRYDARFFAVPRTVLREPARESLSDELEAVGWFNLVELATLPLARITRRILEDVESRLSAETLFDPRQPMPFYHVEDDVSKRDLI